jgi:flagellar protein FlgJ
MATPEQLGRLKAVVPAAQAAEAQYGVPASVTLAQWVLESAWGQSKLATQANNCFGVKAEHLNVPGSYAEFPTMEYMFGVKKLVLAGFEKYANAEASFEDHAKLLHDAPRYVPAMKAAKSPQAFALMLQKCGYSTNPNYGTALIELMREHDLYQYDNPLPQPPAAEKEAA